MKKLSLLTLCLLAIHSFSHSQECVDPSLIDPMAICPMIYMPVCGCDGVTYSNSCIATTQGGVTSWTEGECSTTVCMNLSEIDFGLCDMYLGVGWNGVTCMGFSGCGYVQNDIDYSPFFFDTYEECLAQCGGEISCINPSQIEPTPCPLIYMPVCGCDGVTYGNSCEAYYGGGVTSYSPGACNESVYCAQIPEFVSFGECAMALGFARIGGSCVFVSGCGYIGSNGYDYTSFFSSSEVACNAQCAAMCPDPSVIDPNMGCLMIYDPVCGCDNVTYSNDCIAYYQNGITVFTPGECTVGVSENALNSLILYPNPTNDLLTIQSEYGGMASIVITDLLGKEIIRLNNGAIKNRQIPVDQLASGSYILQVVTTNGLRKPIHFVKQ